METVPFLIKISEFNSDKIDKCYSTLPPLQINMSNIIIIKVKLPSSNQVIFGKGQG